MAVPTTTLDVVIHGVDLPGLTCGPPGTPGHSQNIHVGIQHKKEVIEIFPGDAKEATWSFAVTVKHTSDGLDFAGPMVQGKRGERYVYLSWGEYDGERFAMFRRAKLYFVDAPPDVLAAGVAAGHLRCRVNLTDAKGNPICARLRAPNAVWT